MRASRILFLALFALQAVAFAADPDLHIQGAGATFPMPFYMKCVESFNQKHADLEVGYAGGGSGAGIKGATDRTLDFAATDAPLTAAQRKKFTASYQLLPTVASPIVIIYNLPKLEGKDPLILSGEALADIYLGKIKNWNDPALQKLNPGRNLPDQPIVCFHTSDGSGTTYAFTHYLSLVSKEWRAKVGYATSVEWPGGVGGKGGVGIAAQVKNQDGGISYFEYAYAIKEGLPRADMINAAGHKVSCTLDSAQAAMDALTEKDIPGDFVLNLNNSSAKDAWPIVGCTYLILIRHPDNPALDRGIHLFATHILDQSVTSAHDLGYAGLSKTLYAKAVERLNNFMTAEPPTSQSQPQ